MSAAELQEGAKPIAHRMDEQVVVLRDPTRAPDDVPHASRPREQRYVFDAAFDASATQETVYRATSRGLVAGVLSGSNATVFAYGPTGCGKTHTMLGSDGEPGVCARALGDLFQAIEDAGGDTEYEVSMSYLEIYNETLRDLLNPSLGYLELREDARGTVQVAGLTEVLATSAEEVVRLLARGNRWRRQEPTAANGTSSRSHAVLQVTVRQRHRGTALRRGRLLMIDLAGSERAAQTQNRGQRMKEGAHINRSLLALGNCIEALSSARGSKYINYRDSKLTRLLKDSLGGKSRTVMIAHISPASTAFEESRTTLAYAARAKSIRTKVRHNLLSASCCMAQCGGTVADLRRDILHPDSQQDSEPAPAQVRLGCLREELLGACREQAALRQCLLQLEGTVLRAQLEASRHLLALSRWEQRARRWGKEGQREPDGPGETQRNWDMGDEKSGAPGPPDVAVAHESFVALAEEQGRLREQKAELARCFQRSQQHARGLQEPAELRPRSLLGGSRRPRALCTRIVQQQRQLTADRRLSVPRALQELYQTHLEELPGGPDRTDTAPPEGTSLPQIPWASRAESLLDAEQDRGRAQDPRHPTAPWPPLHPKGDSAPSPMFKMSPRAGWKGSAVVPMPLPGRGTVALEQRTPQASTNTQHDASLGSGTGSEVAVGRRESRETSSSTKRLSAKATRRWSHTPGGDSPAGTAACLGAAQPSPSLGTRPWARKKLETREGSLDAERRKGRRSRSFEATGHRLVAPPGSQMLQNLFKPTVPVGTRAAGTQGPPKTLPRARPPQNQQPGAGDPSLPVPTSTRKGQHPRLGCVVASGTGASGKGAQSCRC